LVEDASPERVGLIGHPVAHSRSPAMQQAALGACGIAAHYALWDTTPADLAARVTSLRVPGMLGANVTVPHKLAVMPFLDELAPSATRISGSVNTVVAIHADGGTRLVGHSTDPAGLLAALSEAQVELKGRRVVLLGAGGAAHAVAGLVISVGARSLAVAARRLEAASGLLSGVQRRLPESPSKLTPWALSDGQLRHMLHSCDVLINATSAGMEGVASDTPLDLTLLESCPPHTFVCDLVYAPLETPLLRAARERGLTAMNGLPMLLHQGAASFALWTGQKAPLDVMRAALGMSPAG
jgi:shikimate dehydrogenase